MSAGSELLAEIAKNAGSASPDIRLHNVLSFEVEYLDRPEIEDERRRIATSIGTENFELTTIHKDLPRYLVLRFSDVGRSISRRGQFAIADELATRLNLRSCIPEGVTNFPTDDVADNRDIEGQFGEEILNRTCWSKIDTGLAPDWIVEFVGLQAAWKSTKGAGVRIAQPDTGIAKHAELDGNINEELAFDVFKGQAGSATDPLTSSMGNPGHGTATGSVINSTHKSIVLGVAPEAELVPIRCVNSVIFGLDGSNIAKAILYAREIGVHVISMSLGGPFVSNSIRDALELATRDGIIVISAAGNCVGVVVYPAFDRNSIAIAGVGAKGKKWKGSSTGPDIDVAAPSENVFAARRDAGDGGQEDVRQSQGTSYGTALTAGVAALWLSKHGVDDVHSAAASKGITVNALFRSALQQTARVPDQWDRSLGAGIVNAEDLLALDPSDVSEEGVPRPENDVFASHNIIVELAQRAENVDGFDWARHGAEAVYLSAESVAREDPRLSALSESPSLPLASDTLAKQQLPAALKDIVTKDKDAPLIAQASSPPADPNADSLSEFRQGGLEGGPAGREELLARRLGRIRGMAEGGIEDLASGTERVIERLNSQDVASAAFRGDVHKAGMEAIEQIRQGEDPRNLSLEARLGFEAIVRLTDRPALQLENDAISVDDPMFSDGGWGALLAGSPQISRVSKAVGRINLDGRHAGTGFAVADDLIMTNRHVLEVIAEEVKTSRGPSWVFPFGKAEIDFSFDGRDGASFEIQEVAFAGPTPTFGKVNFRILDLVLLRVVTGAGYPEHPLDVANKPFSMNEETKLYVVGYPAQPGHNAFVDPDTGKFSLEISKRLNQIYDLQFGKKYLSPGQVMRPTGSFSDDPQQWVFSHDATTLGGNSGSLVIPLNDQGEVVGLHFAGSVLTGNYAHEIAKTSVNTDIAAAENPKTTGNGLQKLTGGHEAITTTERTLQPLNIRKLVHWHDRYVCRIDVQSTSMDPKGTGFLVAEDLVLTNFHVVENVDPKHIFCRFDYKDSKNIGRPIKVLGILAHSPYNEAEQKAEYTTASYRHPEPYELDFALLRLESPAGRAFVPNPDKTSGRRGFIDISALASEAELDPEVYILQHPFGKPLKYDSAPIIEGHGATTRVRYKTNTEKGSSGSPCFRYWENESSLVPVALHNYGDPNWCDGEWKVPEFNHGIPIHLIAGDLEQKGVWPLQSGAWRFKMGGLAPLRWLCWRATDFYEYLLRIVTAPKYFLATIATVLGVGALIGAYFWLHDARPTIASTKYAWFTPSSKSDPHKRARLALNLTVLPPKTDYRTMLSAKLFVGDAQFPMAPTSWITKISYKCLVESSCEKNVFDQPFVLEKGEDFAKEVEFTPASPKASWYRLMEALFHNEKVSFVYKLSYWLQADIDNERPPRSTSITCELDGEQVKELKTSTPYSWDTKLPPAFSPFNLSCMSDFDRD